MKKLIAILSVIFLFSLPCNGQKLKEWVQQKKTQKEYLIEQIVALKLYLLKLKKGYDIAHKGLNTISDIKNGNFNMHRDFFRSLKNVKPAISNSAKVADIIAFQFYLSREMKEVYEFCQRNENFSPEEIRFIARIHTNMLLLCDASVSELLSIIRSNETEMTDNERLQRIDKIYDDMADKRAFVWAFRNDAHSLATEREKEKIEVQMLKQTFNTL
jgi:hypothetical protein